MSKSQYSSDLSKMYLCLSRFNVDDNTESVYYRQPKKNISSVKNTISIRRKLKQLQTTQPTTLIPLTTDAIVSPKSPNHEADHQSQMQEDEIQPTNIVILKITEYDKIKTGKYSLNDLRILCGHYALKKSGSKPELISRIYIHLKQSCLIVKIQRKFRNYIAMQYRNLNGPAFLKPKICVNDTDFYTFDKLVDIDPHKLFSFKDVDGKIYGFHIASIYNLIISSFPEITNPYNRNIIPLHVIENVYDKLIYGTLLNIKVSIKLDQDDDVPGKISPEKQEELFIVGLFQHINTLGNYSDSDWFTSLRRNDYVRFVRNIYDIWNYRANLTQEVKERICPPTGNPFMMNNTYININIVNLFTEGELRTVCASIIERMIMRGLNREDQCLGAFYVLATLTIVNQDARNALPWLYEAVL
jgi:hypothetical protein